MVLPDQYLERATIIASGELCLEGLYHRGRHAPPVLIVPPPAERGSPMDLPLVAELAWACHRADHPTLRFNPRGLGASQGAPGGAGARVADAVAALDALLETERAAEAAVVGVGAGAEVALALGRARPCAALSFVAPPAELAPALAGAPGRCRVFVAVEAAWPGERPEVERIDGADPAFLRGLPALGHAVAAFISRG